MLFITPVVLPKMKCQNVYGKGTTIIILLAKHTFYYSPPDALIQLSALLALGAQERFIEGGRSFTCWPFFMTLAKVRGKAQSCDVSQTITQHSTVLVSIHVELSQYLT